MNNPLAKSLIVLLALPAIALPVSALAYLIYQGFPALSWQFVSSAEQLEGFASASGILPQLTGSLLLALLAVLIALPLALGTALYHQIFASPRQQRSMDSLFNMLQGIPPIVFGLFGLLLLVYLFNWGVSLASGAVILAMVILPMLVLNTLAGLVGVASQQTESARALGLNWPAVILRVWLPQAWRPLVTGTLLAIARALSETAPILFTATVFSGVLWPESIFDPVTSLQTHIFYLAQEGGGEEAIQAVWGSALVLIILVAGFGLLARSLRKLGVER